MPTPFIQASKLRTLRRAPPVPWAGAARTGDSLGFFGMQEGPTLMLGSVKTVGFMVILTRRKSPVCPRRSSCSGRRQRTAGLLRTCWVLQHLQTTGLLRLKRGLVDPGSGCFDGGWQLANNCRAEDSRGAEMTCVRPQHTDSMSGCTLRIPGSVGPRSSHPTGVETAGAGSAAAVGRGPFLTHLRPGTVEKWRVDSAQRSTLPGFGRVCHTRRVVCWVQAPCNPH